MGESMVRRVGIAVRRNRFERTRIGKSFDETLPLTDNELDDARAAIEAMRVPTPDMANWIAWEVGITEKWAAEMWSAAIDEALKAANEPR